MKKKKYKYLNISDKKCYKSHQQNYINILRHICYNCHYQFIEHYPTRLPNKNELNI